MASINWAELQKTAGNTSFDPLPSSNYDVEVEKAEAKTAQSSGKLMFVVTFKVINGPYANRKLWNNFVVSPESEGAMGYFFRHMKALGLNAGFFEQNPEPDTIANQLVGRRVTVEVGQRVWQGETKNEVKGVKPFTGETTAVAAPPPPPAPPAPPAPPTPTAEAETESANVGASDGPPSMPF